MWENLVMRVSFILPVLILILVWMAVEALVKKRKHRAARTMLSSGMKNVLKQEQEHVQEVEIYELRKKLQRLHRDHEKLVSKLQTQIHELKEQLRLLNAQQISDLKARDVCIDTIKKERDLLEKEIEALKAQLRALDFRI